MPDLNKVFSVIQAACLANEKIEGIAALQRVADELAIEMDRLHFCLDCIQQIGLIVYDAAEKRVTLTAKGRKRAISSS